MLLVYLDQNYASRVAKYLLGQAGNEPFGRLYEALRRARPCVPPSPFHVLETRGGYLLPALQRLFEETSRGLWVRPWQEVVARQAARGGLAAEGSPRRDELLGRAGDWQRPADLAPLDDLLDLPLSGGFFDRSRTLRRAVCERLGLGARAAPRLPFVQLLARLAAFRSLDAQRWPRPSDLTDLVMAATVGPYVDVLATDRYLRETLRRVGYDRWAFSGRRGEVLRFAELLGGGALAPLRRTGGGGTGSGPLTP